jgi:hypothetical protein
MKAMKADGLAFAFSLMRLHGFMVSSSSRSFPVQRLDQLNLARVIQIVRSNP